MLMRRPSPLRARRLLRGERLRDVARAIGAHDTVVSLLERGDRPLRGRLLHALAAHYATPAAQLLAEMARWIEREQRAATARPARPMAGTED
jgi:transcriptional regulator with XRE-family HTH domain